VQALVISRFGGPADLEIGEVPTPVPKDGEMLLRVEAAGVNRSDLLNLAGIFPTALPRIPGRDFAGTVVKGPKSMIGNEVWGAGSDDLGFSRDGSHCEYMAIGVDYAVPVPSGVSRAGLGVSGVAYLTAARALLESAEMQAGETVLVVGAAGGVGSAAVQIALWKGARVLGTTGSSGVAGDLPAAVEHLGSALGGEELSAGVLECTAGKGVDVVIDTAAGGPLLDGVVASVGLRGRVVAITAAAEPRGSLDLLDFYRKEARLLGLNTSMPGPRSVAEILADLVPGFASGALAPLAVDDSYPLRRGNDAYARLVGGKSVHGRILLAPGLAGD
jgi:NADPH:quinone reductase-like Zn-dependent oxidoreductase